VKAIACFDFILVYVNGKLVFRAGFLNCLNYVFEKQGARLIDSNMANTNPTALATEFDWVANRSRRIQKPVMHLSLSPHPDDASKLNDVQKRKFTVQLLESIGMENCQWVLVEHNDTVTVDEKLRPHLHVVANRIPLNNHKAVNSSFLKRRIEKSLQQLRQEYDLQPVLASWEVERKAPSTGQVRCYRQEQEDYETGKRSHPPQLPTKTQLQNAIDEAAQTCSTLAELIDALKHQGIETEVCLTPNDRVKGIVYRRGRHHFSGSQLGKAYTVSGLQQYRQIDGDRYLSPPTIAAEPNHESEAIASSVADELQSIQTQLKSECGFPNAFTQALYERGLLKLNEQNRPIWVKQPLGKETTDPPVFWLATGEPVNRAIITASPIEATSAFLVESERQQPQPTLYLSIDSVRELPINLLNKIDEVVVSLSNQQFTQTVMKQLSHIPSLSATNQKWNKTWQQLQQQTQSPLKQNFEL
jgi:hypothetical protein